MSSADPASMSSPPPRPSSTSRLAEPEPPQKRNCLGCAVKGSLGCLAFVLGGLLVTYLLADRLSNGVAKRFVTSSFGDTFKGELEIGEVNLGFTDWSARQSISDIRLIDPEGEEVLTANVELPPLGEILSVWTKANSSEELELGLIRIAVSGDIVADDGGLTNLERVLEEKEFDPSVGEITLSGPGTEELDTLDLLSRLSMEFALDISELSYSDARTRELGGEVVVRQFTARALGRAGGAWRFNLDGDIAAPGDDADEGKLFAEFNAPEPTWGRPEWPLGTVRGQGSAKGLRTAVLDGLSGQNGLISELLGDTVDLEFHLVEATPESGRVELISHSAKQDLVFEGQFKEGRLSIDGTEGFTWRIEAPKRFIDETLMGLMPEESGRLELATPAPGERITVMLDRLEIPISDTAQMSEDGFSAMRSARGSRFAGHIEVPSGLAAHLPSGTLDVRASDGTPLLRFEQAEDGVPHMELRLEVQDRESDSPDASLSVDVEGRGLWRRFLDPDLAESELADVLEADADVRFELLHAASFQRFMPVDEDLAAWIGSSGVLELRVPNALSEERVMRGGWTSETLRVDLDLKQASDALLTASSSSGPAVRVRFLGPQLERRLQQALPSGDRVSLPGAFEPEGGAVFELSQLRLAKSEGDDGGIEFARSQLAGNFSVPSLRVRSLDPSTPEASLESLILAFSMPESGPMRVDLSSQVANQPEAQLEAHLLGNQPWFTLLEDTVGAEAGGESSSAMQRATFDVNADARSVPTILVDGLSKGDGLLVDVLGDSLAVEVRAANFGMNAGRLEAQFESALGEVQWMGRMEEGRLVSDGEDGIDASVALTPLFSSRIVGNLVPLLVNVSKDDELAPVTLELSNCVLPLDGDLTKLSGEVQLNLGEVYYSVLPQFEEWLGDMTRTKATEILPLAFKIQNGVVAYDKLPIKIEGEIYDFAGTFDLTSRKLALSTSMPLSNLGSSVSKELARAREKYDLDPNLAVPFEIGGTLTRPRVGIASGFLGGLAGDLLEKGLEKELLKGLEKLLGKD